jgi:hypothetical protein
VTALVAAWGTPAGASLPGRISGSVAYAIVPLLLAFLAAGVAYGISRARGKPIPFNETLLMVWGLLLAMAMIDLGAQVLQR